MKWNVASGTSDRLLAAVSEEQVKVEFAELTGTFDLRVLAMSVVLAFLMPYAGFELVERARAARDRAKKSWVLIGGVVLGIGVWGTVELAICSYQLPIPVCYHYPTLLLALLASILTATIRIVSTTQEYVSVPRALATGFLTGATATAVPYLCLKSFRFAAAAQYRWGLVGASAALSVLIFLLVLVFDVGVQRVRPRSSWRRSAISFIVGTATMFWALGALWTIRIRTVNADVAVAYTFPRSLAALAAIAGACFLVLSGTILVTTLSRLHSLRQELFAKAHERETFFNNLAEAIPGVVWIANEKGQTTYINRHWYEMTGTSPTEQVGAVWMDSMHPDDRQVLAEKWKSCLGSGQTFEIEYRLLDAVRGYRWYLDRAVPLRDDKGTIQQWFGTCTDIEEQKLYQQTLEKQIKERTEELADANTHLQQEMWEKDLARRTLDEQNEKMLRTLEARSRRATLLAKMGELLQSCIAREEVVTAAVGFAPKIFPFRRGAIALFNAEHNLVEIAGEWNTCQLPLASFEGEACWALRTGHQHLVPAGDLTARCQHAIGLSNTYLCVPILAQGEALGILHIQATDGDPEITEAEMSFHATFAAQVGLSVANIRLREALKTQSIKDPLTGLYNRRYLQEVLEREIRRSIRSEQHLGILILDLDHFKKFNDTYGHEAGDSVLRETASLLVRSVRAEDFVCRYGGEEFVVVLPTADLRAAEARAQRIREKLRDLLVMDHGRSLGIITASIGVAALPDQGTNEKELLQAADAALYRAKREGRDRVVVADMPATKAAPEV